jgi:hypothetical protein
MSERYTDPAREVTRSMDSSIDVRPSAFLADGDRDQDRFVHFGYRLKPNFGDDEKWWDEFYESVRKYNAKHWGTK